MINLLPRRDLVEAGEGMEEGGEVSWGSAPGLGAAALVALLM